VSDLTSINGIIVHHIGNKLREEEIQISRSLLEVDNPVKELLLKYFLSPFKSNEYYNLHHESEVQLNEVYTYVARIFDNPDELLVQSINLAKHLYEQSTHPKIKAGEFYVVYFKKCLVEDMEVDAIGLFKSENKDTYLKVFPKGDNFEINYEDGININKLDKGCLIFNTEKDKGYLVSIVDTVSRGFEAQYWKDDFLHLKQREDNYHHTKNVLNLCKSFVTEKLPKEFEASKADQAIMLNKSADYFKMNDTFQMDEFAAEVIQQPEVIKAFKEYRNNFEEEKDVRLIDGFDISSPAFKKQQKVFKSIIKLDKNFHIYIHGNREMIEKGKDEANGMHYYKLFYKEES
jgi:hypothetical protein